LVLLGVKEVSYKQQLASRLYQERIFYVQTSFAIVRGIPDLIFFTNGIFYAVELKMPGGTLSVLQADRLVMIAQAKGQAFVVTLDDGFKAVTVIRVNDRKIVKMTDFKNQFPTNLINWRKDDGRDTETATLGQPADTGRT
jgi:hypothetical protein